MASEWAFRGFRIEYKEERVGGELLWESHCHASFEAIAVLEGDITLALEGKPYRITAGECALIGPLAYHTVAANMQGAYHRITAKIEASSVPAPLRPVLSAEDRRISVFSFSGARALRDAFLSADRAFYAPLAESVLVSLLYESLRGEGQGGTEPDRALSRILSYIDRHLFQPITLADIALNAALSSSSVCHLFSEKMKISPKQHILQKKLATAQKLIGEGISPTEAALRIGYEDYSNFYRAYRRQFGKKPSCKD